MYTPDIVTLRNFYATPFGESVRSLISNAILQLWPAANGDVVVGLGYSTPYLSPYLKQATPLVACMPASQGAAYWPNDGDNLVLIAHDSELPFAESSVNRVLLVHSIENSEQLSWIIQEIWRILTPSGRMLVVVPNRRGMWSRSSRSPFGYGRPFSIAQVRDLLTTQNFTITRTRSALFMPPTRIKCLWRGANKLEAVGRFICKFLGGFLGGVLLVEAEKKIYSTIRQPVVEARNYRGALAGGRAVLTLQKKNVTKS
ncbi:MAG: methyltransferase domain-containing protein [Rickettsiales bacterium]|jgi:SAM-dependent methyltransferase